MRVIDDRAGIEFRTEHFQVFFGFGTTRLDFLKMRFNQYDWRELKQVHGNTVVESAQGDPVEADGHWTFTQHRALLIKTADCLPVMLAHPDRVCALHAGWRGLVSEILVEGARHYANQKVAHETMAFIGPHIAHRNFEVDQDVADQIDWAYLEKRSSKEDPESILALHPSKPKKYLADLSALAVTQLVASGIPRPNIYLVGQDTFSQPHLHSFRRDGTSAGRNLNFVVKL